MTRMGFATWHSGFGDRSFKLGITLAILATIFSATCTPRTGPKAGEPFPQSGEVADWAKSSATRTFAAESLWEYVDGDAERYVQAGVVQTLTSDYKFRGRVDTVADIHYMRSAEGPGKLLAAESSEGSKPARIGDEARLFPASLVFRQDRFLVRVVAYEEAPGIGNALTELGQAIEKKLQTQHQ
ncbi:MAG: hypothetical protein HY508_15130 [Acidobacteria bacterium]|nr:hypothetical protein [Acidobacteriota bacterium]